MPYTYTLTTTIPASAQEIYDAWLDSVAHSTMTGGEASMSDEIGGGVSAWDGYISGRNLKLVPGERIVQSWRTSEFTDEHEDSIVTVTLEEVDGGTLLTLEHSNVPDEQKSYEESGWRKNYFEPMVAYFVERRAAETPPKAARQTARKAAPEAVPMRAVKPAPKVKRAAGAKSRRAAPPAKASSGRKTTTRTRTVARTAARKRAKPSRRKSGPGKRR